MNKPVDVKDQQEQPEQSKCSLITNTESSTKNNQITKSQALLITTPKQNSLKTKIADLQSIVNGLYKQRNLGLLRKDDMMLLEKYEKKLGVLEKELKRVKQNQENQQKVLPAKEEKICNTRWRY